MQLGKMKAKLYVALVLFLICAVLLITAAYAWLVLSRAPEITGVTTQIGANGSLEIVLLSNETYDDPGNIKAGVGSSMEVQDKTKANAVWGNLVDLSDESYGLDKISLRPSRLSINKMSEEILTVNDNILIVPDYGIDGRVKNFLNNVFPAMYENGSFVFYQERQNYGVRGIGSHSGISGGMAYLATARSSVAHNMSMATESVESAWKLGGENALKMLAEYYATGSGVTYSEEEVNRLASFLDDAGRSMEYIDMALRQSAVGVAASYISDEMLLTHMKTGLLNREVPLSSTVSQLNYSGLDEIRSQAITVENDMSRLKSAADTCRSLGGGCTWDDVEPLLTVAIDPEKIYIGDQKLTSLSETMLVSDNQITLAPASGAMADIADYVGNYSVMFDLYSKSVEVKSVSAVNPSYLAKVSEKLAVLKPAGSNTAGGDTGTALEEMYGFAVDMAFRCNAANSSLLFQTEETQRIDPESDNAETMGYGSFVRFSSENMSDDAVVSLMNSVRVVFIDDMSQVLAVAKANTSNHEKNDEGEISAPLYLYGYTVNSDNSISTLERRKGDPVITALTQNEAKTVTVIFYLDGDSVSNNLADISGSSVTGKINLEFASDVDLIPSKAGIEK